VGCSVQQDQREIEHEQGRTKDGVVSFRYVSGINKPGFNPLAAQTTTNQVTLFSWGNNGFGALGLGNITYYSSPKQVGSLTNWLNLTGGQYLSIATKSDGTLWTWGRGQSGQLGLGNTTDYSSPKQVGSLTNWNSISTARFAVLATKTDGTLWSWGNNYVGSLGLGNTTYYSSPKQVGALTTWLRVAMSGYGTSYAITTSGALYSWGSNFYGELGRGTSGGGTNTSSPVQIGALTNWLNIACGRYSALSVKTDGTLWTWGLNNWGQLGLGNTTNYSSPKQIGALTAWSKTSGCGTFAFSIKTDGTLWSWGRGLHGSLGLGNTTNYSSPKQVGALTNWSKLNIGSTSTGAIASIKTDGTLWVWGNNAYGQLGLNNLTYYSSPKQLGSLTTWAQAAVGQYHILAA
jgi:alpha-tubulin suppressor-like RCC1 family protein